MSFYLTHVTYVYHWVCPKWFPCPWYTRRKSCTYLTPRLTLSPNGSKQASTWTTSPWSTIGCVKMIFEPMVCSSQTMHLSCIENNTISKWNETSLHFTHVTYEYLRCAQSHFDALDIRRKLYICVAPRLKISPNGSKWASVWSTSPRSTIRCDQNDFSAYDTFNRNYAPILCPDYHYLQTDRNKLPLDIHYLGVPSGVPKAISMPLVYSA
jgi:hypothetical protein